MEATIVHKNSALPFFSCDRRRARRGAAAVKIVGAAFSKAPKLFSSVFDLICAACDGTKRFFRLFASERRRRRCIAASAAVGCFEFRSVNSNEERCKTVIRATNRKTRLNTCTIGDRRSNFGQLLRLQTFQRTRIFIFDCSAILEIDCVESTCFKQILVELRKTDCALYLVRPSDEIVRNLKHANAVCKGSSIKEAIDKAMAARKRLSVMTSNSRSLYNVIADAIPMHSL